MLNTQINPKLNDVGDKIKYICIDCDKEFQDMPYDNVCPDCGSLVYIKEDVKMLNTQINSKLNGVGDKIKYICKDCDKEFQDMPYDNVCPNCGSLVYIKEDVKILNTQINPKVAGENGLGIIVMDFSGSMEEPAFPNEPEYTNTKLNMVASALKSSIIEIKNMSKADKAYVALIGFTGNAKLLGVFKASEINENIQYWNNWFRDSMSDVCESYGYSANIDNALKLAREIYDDALQGNLESYGIHNFAPMYQSIAIGSHIYEVANVRVFVYSDGMFESGFTNYFKNASLIPGKTNVSGVTSAFLGNIDDDGYETMESIAGVCPIHGIKAVIHINQSKNYSYLRDLFHMTSSTSGFCVECTKHGKRIGLRK
jgi:DNA-directed RNA polymerase subunit RPC12/RpoP